MASKAKLAVGLDLGSGSTRVVICALENESLRFLGHGEAPSQAWNRGRLSDQGALPKVSGLLCTKLNRARKRRRNRRSSG